MTMDDTASPPLDEGLKRNVISFSTILARMPANVMDRPFAGELAAMEVVRIIRAVHALDARLALVDHRQGGLLEEVAAAGASLTLNGQHHELAWALFHRSGLAAFDHLLCGVQGEILMITAHGTPLMEENGVRLLRRHRQAMLDHQEGAGEFLKELEGVADMIRSGGAALPFGLAGGDKAGE